jgi:hypothetical protein
MHWHRIRENFPAQWVLVEALQAHIDGNRRDVEELSLVGVFPNSRTALHSYVDLHEQAPQRELYVVHTDRDRLEILQRRWLGIRPRGD